MSLEVPKGDVRKEVTEWNPGWEEATPDQKEADTSFFLIESDLKKIGFTITPEKKILEIGSGKGALLEYMLQRGLDAVGVDARARGKPSIPQAEARIEQLPFADSVFDFILSKRVFDSVAYHQNQALMLAEIARVLKPGGIYYASGEDLDIVAPSDLRPIKEITEHRFVDVFKKT